MPHDHESSSPPRFWRSRLGLGWLVLAGVAGWLLWAEHRAHLLGALPYLLLLACPLMHVFMHRGHGHGHRHPGADDAKRSTTPDSERPS